HRHASDYRLQPGAGRRHIEFSDSNDRRVAGALSVEHETASNNHSRLTQPFAARSIGRALLGEERVAPHGSIPQGCFREAQPVSDQARLMNGRKKQLMNTLTTISPDLQARISNRTARVGVIGLGYVGLPLALLFSEQGFSVTGFDTDESKV